MNRYLMSSLSDVEQWLTRVYPKVSLNEIGEYFPDYDGYKIENLIPFEDETMFDLDMNNLQHNLYGTGINADNVIVPCSGLITIGDIRARMIEIFSLSFMDMYIPEKYRFLRDVFSRGILEPYYFINTILEVLVLSLREGNYECIETLSDFGVDILSKFFLSWLSTLRTGINRDYNLLYRFSSEGRFNDISLYDLFQNYFLEDNRFLKHTAIIYNELKSLISIVCPLDRVALFKSLNGPDQRDGLNRNYLIQIYMLKDQ